MEVVEHRSTVMASRLHVVAAAAEGALPPGILDDAVADAVRYLGHLEACWSRFVESSDVSRINRLGAAGGRLTVEPSTLLLLATMVEGHVATAGRFDPTVLRAVVAEGYEASRTDPTRISRVPDGSTISMALHDLELDPTTNTVTVPAGLVVDPGGVGKGLAADLAAALLLDAGVEGAMVEIGGDLATAGTPVDPAGWIVDVEHPDPADGLVCSLAISGGGVATSSVRSRRWIRDGIERHHQIDPRTGTCSTTDLTAVTVIAPAGWSAEVHATAALAIGSDGVISYLDGHGLSGLAIATSPEGDRVWTTSDLAEVDLHLRTGVR
jgi:thiamine biosynthesis lipoprotein